MKIAFCSSEVVPFSKTGGLADVSGSLPTALAHQGHEVVVLTPRYKSAKAPGAEASLPGGVKVWFIEGPQYFDRDSLYGDKRGDYPDNLERFAHFSRQALELLKKKKFAPDVLHCNDWQSSLMPVYLTAFYRLDPFFARTRTVLTIHNLAYQGVFPKEAWAKTGLPWELFNIEGLEFYDRINVLKGGINFSHAITTVSPTYAQEIQGKEFGCGLEGVLVHRRRDLYGILNGIDTSLWDPRNDGKIFKNFSADSLEGKQENKAGLQRETELPTDGGVPMIGMISRLADQKGFDLVAAVINEFLGMKVQFVVLGTGDAKYHHLLESIAQKYRQNASFHLTFDAILAQKIYAGSDFFLMPSRFEPCGLGQLISLRYGTIPIVRRTGGLADTIVDYDAAADTGNGFSFSEYDAKKLLETIRKALAAYQNRAAFQKLVRRAMALDFSWDESAKAYGQVYRKAVEKPRF